MPDNDKDLKVEVALAKRELLRLEKVTDCLRTAYVDNAKEATAWRVELMRTIAEKERKLEVRLKGLDDAVRANGVSSLGIERQLEVNNMTMDAINLNLAETRGMTKMVKIGIVSAFSLFGGAIAMVSLFIAKEVFLS